MRDKDKCILVSIYYQHYLPIYSRRPHARAAATLRSSSPEQTENVRRKYVVSCLPALGYGLACSIPTTAYLRDRLN